VYRTDVEYNLERVFKVIDYVDSKPNEFLKQVWPGLLVDVFPDSILDKGPDGSILYYDIDSTTIHSERCYPDTQRVFLVPFVGGSFFKNPEGVDPTKPISLIAIQPFKAEDEGIQERIQAILDACRLKLDPVTAYQSEYQHLAARAQQWGITWVHTGNPTDGILETIPNEPGNYLCGKDPAGLFYKLPSNRYCITLDTRKCALISVMAD